jgi:MFS family permease
MQEENGNTQSKSTEHSALSRLQTLVSSIRTWRWTPGIFDLRGIPQAYHTGIRAFGADSLLTSVSDSLYLSYISLYILALGGSRGQVGWFTSLASLLGMLSPILGAALTRRWGRRKPIVVVFAGLFRLMLLLAALVPFFLEGPAAVVVLIAVFALRAGFLNVLIPAWLSLTGDIVPTERRGRYLASRSVLMAIISIVMVPLAGQLIEWYGAPSGYQIALGIAFVTGMGATYAYSHIPEEHRQPPPSGGIGSQLHSLWHALTANRTFLGFVLIRLLCHLALMIGGPYFAVYQVEVLKSPVGIIGIVTTVRAITRMIGLRVWGTVLDKRSARWVTTVAAFGVPILPFIWIFFTQPWHVIFVSIPSGFLWAGFELGSFALLLELLDGEESTEAAAGHTSLLAAASVIGPLIGGWVIDRVGYLWDFSLSGAVRLVGALLFVWLLKPFGARVAERATEGG